jgi:hypothetical protein
MVMVSASRVGVVAKKVAHQILEPMSPVFAVRADSVAVTVNAMPAAKSAG